MISDTLKAQLIISKLGDNRDKVLALLPPHIASELSSNTDIPSDIDKKELPRLLESIITDINNIPSVPSSTTLNDHEKKESHQPTSLIDLGDDDLEAKTTNTTDETTTPEASEESEETQAENELMKYNSPQKIATELSKQKPQIIAFFVANLDNEMLKQAIMYHLDDTLKSTIESTVVESTPITQKVYQKLYDQLCLKKEEDPSDTANMTVDMAPPVDNTSIETNAFLSSPSTPTANESDAGGLFS